MKVMLYINGYLWAEDASPVRIEQEARRMHAAHSAATGTAAQDKVLQHDRVLVMSVIGTYDGSEFAWTHRGDK